MTPEPQPPPSVAPSVLPLVALILAILGLCLPPIFPVAVVLAIVSLVRGNDPRYAARRTLTYVALGLAVLWVPMTGILAAIAIPNFIRFKARAKQSECKTTLRAAWTAERAFKAEHDAYSTSPSELGLTFDRTRYLYRFDRLGALSEVGARPTHPQAAPLGQLETGIPPAVLETVGISGTCPACEVTIVCAGNVDSDSTVDVWTISTAERVDASGSLSPAGVPRHDVDDLSD